MSRVYLNQLGMISPLGNSVDATKRELLELVQSGVALSDVYSPGRSLPVGRIDADFILPPMDAWPLPDRSRNNQIALAALQQIRPAVQSAIERFGSARVGVVIGTSTSGVGEAEAALRDYLRPEHCRKDFTMASKSWVLRRRYWRRSWAFADLPMSTPAPARRAPRRWPARRG